MSRPWSVQEAKARLSEVLRRARAGAPQRIGIGARDSCVVVSAETWASLGTSSLGAWLVDSAPHGKPLEEAPRSSRRGDPFATEADTR